MDVDLPQILSTPARLSISLPEYLVRQIDDYAKAHYQTHDTYGATLEPPYCAAAGGC